MGVRTTSDELCYDAKEKIKEAQKLLIEVIDYDVCGFSEYNNEYILPN